MTAPTDPEGRAWAAEQLAAMDARDAAAAQQRRRLEYADGPWRGRMASDLASQTAHGDRARLVAELRLRCHADPLAAAGEASRTRY